MLCSHTSDKRTRSKERLPEIYNSFENEKNSLTSNLEGDYENFEKKLSFSMQIYMSVNRRSFADLYWIKTYFVC
jgi:hypothetical protein